MAASWIRMLPEPNSVPFNTRSYARARTRSGSFSSKARSSGFGEVNGWWAGVTWPVSLLRSKSGKSVTQTNSVAPAAISPRRRADLEAIAQVRLIQAVFRDRLGVRDPSNRNLDPRLQDFFPYVPEAAPDHVQDVVFRDEGHLEVELGEFGLAIRAKVLVPIAAGYLKIAVQARHHQ